MTASRLLPAAVPVHEHAWITESVHATSEGSVRYVRCVGCTARRVDLDTRAVSPASAVSRVIG